MGNTTTDGNTTIVFDKDEYGNIKYNSNPINIPFVNVGQWSNPDNYHFLNDKFASINGSDEYVSKSQFVDTLNKSLVITTLKDNVDGLTTKYSSMQTTYNSNFNTIANNLGMTIREDGTVSGGSTDSSTFVTQSTLSNVVGSTDIFNDSNVVRFAATKVGKIITISGNITFAHNADTQNVNFGVFFNINPAFRVEQMISVVLQARDQCGYGETSSPWRTDPPVECSSVNKEYYVKNMGKLGFDVVRPVAIAGHGANFRIVNFIAVGTQQLP